MALSEVGLEAVIKMGGFDAAAGKIAHAFDTINTKAGTVERATGGLGSAFSGLTGIMGSVAGGLGNIATVAGGMIAANVFGKLAQGVGAFVSGGLEAVGAQQKLEAGLGALLTSNNLYEKSVQQVTVATTKQLMSDADLTQKKNELTASINVQKASIQEQQQRLIDLTAKWGDNGLATNEARAKLEQMQVRLQGTTSDLANLTNTQTDYTTQTKTSFNQVMDFKEAQRLAAEQSERLLGFVDKLSIVSPFGRDQVAQVSKYAIAAGLSVENTELFTAGFLDLAAAVGIGTESLDFAADQLLQVAKVGQITEMDMRQLRRMGIDLEKILGVEMKMTVEEFNAKAKESPEIFDELFVSVGRFAKSNFPGAAKAMATSIDGLGSTFKDLMVVAQREFFTPIVEAVTPTAVNIIEGLSDFFLGGQMAQIGNKAGKVLSTFLNKGFGAGLKSLGVSSGVINIANLLGKSLSEAFTGLKTGGLSGLFESLGKMGLRFNIIKQAIGDMISDALPGIRGAIGNLVNDIGVFLVQQWPTVQTALISWASQFWGWLETIAKEHPLRLFGLTGLIAETIINNWPTIQAALVTWRDNFFSWVTELYPQIPTFLTSIVSGVASFLTENWPIISAALAEWSTQFWGWVTEAAAGTATALNALAVALLAWAFSPEAQASMNELGQNLGRMIVDALKLANEGGEGSRSVLLTLASGLLNAVGSIAGTLIIMGGQIVAGILSGILESFGINLKPATFSELKGILTGIGNNIKTIARVVGTNIVNSIKSGWDSAVDTVTDAFSSGVEAWTNIVTETDWAKLGQSMIDGILVGLKKNAAKVLEYLKSLMGDFLATAAGAIGEGSPAKKFIPLGESIPQGLAVGIGQAGGIVQAALDRLLGVNRLIDPVSEAIGAARDDVEKFMDSMKIEGSKSTTTLSILTQTFRDNAAEILNATDRAAKFQEVINRTGINWERIFAGGSSNPFAGKGGGAISTFIQSFDRRFEEIEKATRDMFIRAGRTAVTIGNQLNNMAASLIDPMAEHLNDTVSTLTELIQGAAAAGAERISFEGQIISATQAQEMLNQALTKQRDIQDELTKLRENEMKLGFLEKQLTLMETLQKAGIDIDSVLGGLKLGIDASIPDIVAATNKLVEAMIAQMDEDLQIGSPSKVAVDKAKNFGLSFAEGIKAQGSAIMSAIQGAISAPLIAAPALGAGSATTNVYNINNGGNTINSGMDEATFDARVRQSLQRMMGT